MGKSCENKCLYTASVDGPGGKRLMISVAGNKKFPIAHTLHPRCDSCAEAELAHGELMILFNNDSRLVEQYERLQSKK